MVNQKKYVSLCPDLVRAHTRKMCYGCTFLNQKSKNQYTISNGIQLQRD